MKRVLLVTGIFPPQIGGPATFIDHLAHRLAAQGHQVTVVCATDAPDDYDAARPFKVYRAGMGNRYLFEIKIRALLLWQMMQHDKIFVNGLEEYVGQIAKGLNKKFVLKIVGDRVWETARNLGLTTLDVDDFQKEKLTDGRLLQLKAQRDRAVHCAEQIVTPSRYLKTLVERWDYPSDKISVVLNGIAQNDQYFATQERGEFEPLRLVMSGRMTNWKGIETAILAVRGLDGVTLDIVGDGPELPILVNLVEQMELGQIVRFHGKMPHAELFALYARSHVYLLPSLYEGLSHALIEAGGCALACIAADKGGNNEVIAHNENGLLLPYGDVAAWRRAIESLKDDVLRKRLGTAAKDNARRFDFSETADGASRVLDL